MRIAIILSLLAMLPASWSTGALAAREYNPTEMTCSDLKSVVKKEGVVQLRWRSPDNPSIVRYGEYVAHNGLCSVGQRELSTMVPASDTRSCRVNQCRVKNGQVR